MPKDLGIETCESFRMCKTCPMYGSCSKDGKLQCDLGYERENDECVENPLIRMQAMKTIKYIEKEL